MAREALLLCNLGSPTAPTEAALKPYLTEFLMDPYVIDVNYLMRLILIRGLIVPKRAKESAEAYARIWTSDGSPLVAYTKKLTEKVARLLPGIDVAWGMRYGEPSLEKGLMDLVARGAKRVIVAPLYPQFALASTQSTNAKIGEIHRRQRLKVSIDFLPPFYKEDFYLQASTEIYREFLAPQKPFDHYLFSYHGLPERHVQKTDPSGEHCLKSDNCCEVESPSNRLCYRHHCTVNTREIVRRLQLPADRVQQSFQSRLGKDPWLQPYTDFEIIRLAQQGVKRLAVFSPAFVADCLETLEEIAMRGREDFIKHGGEELVLVPSLNDHDLWAAKLADGITQRYFNRTERAETSARP
jgi:ferrochelatase